MSKGVKTETKRRKMLKYLLGLRGACRVTKNSVSWNVSRDTTFILYKVPTVCQFINILTIINDDCVRCASYATLVRHALCWFLLLIRDCWMHRNCNCSWTCCGAGIMLDVGGSDDSGLVVQLPHSCICLKHSCGKETAVYWWCKEVYVKHFSFLSSPADCRGIHLINYLRFDQNV